MSWSTYKADNTLISMVFTPNVNFREYLIYKNLLQVNDMYLSSDSCNFKIFVTECYLKGVIKFNPLLLFVFYKLLRLPCVTYRITESELLFYMKCVKVSIFQPIIRNEVKRQIEERLSSKNHISVRPIVKLLLIDGTSNAAINVIKRAITALYPMSDEQIPPFTVNHIFFSMDLTNINSKTLPNGSIVIYGINNQNSINIDSSVIETIVIKDEHFICDGILFDDNSQLTRMTQLASRTHLASPTQVKVIMKKIITYSH